MSGILCILNLDGGPVDRGLLHRMTMGMAWRGPDGQYSRTEGAVGLGYARLETTHESAQEWQPFSLDRQTWIVADARVDAREDLIDALVRAGERIEGGAPDVELIARAYRVWGPGCVEHLLGDFAFVVWDAPNRRLFCARDHLGVKPLFYAEAGGSVIVSNTQACVQQHPAVSRRLNDLAIADFLLFDRNLDLTTTHFADVRRLRPAHTATWEPGRASVRRYWTLPIDEPLFLRRAADYTERFRELLGTAVSDRLRVDRVGVFMSGGIDSPTLAVAASRMLRRRGVQDGVHAFTTVLDDGDSERHYAQLVAKRLDIPISFRNLGAASFEQGWHLSRVHTPGPASTAMTLRADIRECRQVADITRVCFYGEGPDNALLYEWQPYLQHLRARRRYGRLAADVIGHAIRHRRVPLLPTLVRKLRGRSGRSAWEEQYPAWVLPSLEARFGLRERWGQYQEGAQQAATHPVRPAGYASFDEVEWELLFRSLDAEETGAPLEVRHPFVDLRLLRFMLSVPAIPWCRAKYLVRRAMREELPREVLTRPKSPLRADPAWVAATTHGLPPLVPSPRLHDYVVPERVPDVRASSMIAFRADFRPRALNLWLNNLHDAPVRAGEENPYEVTGPQDPIGARAGRA